MKKLLMGLLGIACSAAFAGSGNLLITFSTPGPDLYADGSTVLDNECYALVWTGATGAQTTVLTAPFAKDGKCSLTLFQIDEADAAKYSGGTWSVYLLDTRDFAKDATGKTLAGLDENGVAKVVNTSAPVQTAFAAQAGAFTSAAAQEAVAAGSYDLSKVPAPKVSGIRIVGANVVVTVQDTVPFLSYTLRSGASTTDFAVPAGAIPANGNANGEINLVAPKADGAQFFKVTTK